MRFALLVACLAPAIALGAVPTVTITGPVLTPDGSPPAKGTITCSLSQPGSVTDAAAGTTPRVAAKTTFTLGAGGVVPAGAVLVPNDAITPATTAYVCAFRVVLATGEVVTWTEKWRLASTPVTIDIGAITRVEQPTSAVFVPGPKGEKGDPGADSPVSMSFVQRGPVSGGDLVFYATAPRALTLPVNLTGSTSIAGTSASSLVEMAINVVPLAGGSTTIGVLTCSAGLSVCRFSVPTAVNLAAGDAVSIVAPATPDATLASVTTTLLGIR